MLHVYSAWIALAACGSWQTIHACCWHGCCASTEQSVTSLPLNDSKMQRNGLFSSGFLITICETGDVLLKSLCRVAHGAGRLLYIMSAVCHIKDTKESLKDWLLRLNVMKVSGCISIVYCQGLTLYTLKSLASGFEYCKMLESIFVMLF